MIATAEILKLDVQLSMAPLGRDLGPLAASLPTVEGNFRSGPLASLIAFDAAANATLNNPKRSDAERVDDFEAAADVAESEFASFEHRVIDPLDVRATQLEKAIFAADAPATDATSKLLQELQDQEVRAELRKLDPIERAAEYASTKEPRVIRAMETAPPVVWRNSPDAAYVLLPFVSPDAVAAKKLARAMAADPVRAAELKDVQRIARLYRSALATARHALAEVVPVRDAVGPDVTS